MTVKEIKQELDALGIEYDNKMKKEELLKLLEEHTVTAEELKLKKYVVLHDFKDLEDNGYVYFKDDFYPRKENKKVTEKRIQELMSDKNKIGKPLIKEQE